MVRGRIAERPDDPRFVARHRQGGNLVGVLVPCLVGAEHVTRAPHSTFRLRIQIVEGFDGLGRPAQPGAQTRLGRAALRTDQVVERPVRKDLVAAFVDDDLRIEARIAGCGEDLRRPPVAARPEREDGQPAAAEQDEDQDRDGHRRHGRGVCPAPGNLAHGEGQPGPGYRADEEQQQCPPERGRAAARVGRRDGSVVPSFRGGDEPRGRRSQRSG